jgi:hypothetical protein
LESETFKRSVESELTSGNGLPDEGSGSDAQKTTRAASTTKIQPALELSKRLRMKLLQTGASPSMRERRINHSYDALFGVRLQPKFLI